MYMATATAITITIVHGNSDCNNYYNFTYHYTDDILDVQRVTRYSFLTYTVDIHNFSLTTAWLAAHALAVIK